MSYLLVYQGTRVSGEDVIIGKTSPIPQDESQGQVQGTHRRITVQACATVRVGWWIRYNFFSSFDCDLGTADDLRGFHSCNFI